MEAGQCFAVTDCADSEAASSTGKSWRSDHFRIAVLGFDLVIARRILIQRLWPTLIAGQNAGSSPVLLGAQLLSLSSIEFVDAPTLHLRVEHLQGSAAGVDLVVMREIGEAFEDAEQLLVP
jgi:hypothetical protein